MLTTVVLSQQERADGVQIPRDKKASKGKSFPEVSALKIGGS